jgi:hypothetical protein
MGALCLPLMLKIYDYVQINCMLRHYEEVNSCCFMVVLFSLLTYCNAAQSSAESCHALCRQFTRPLCRWAKAPKSMFYLFQLHMFKMCTYSKVKAHVLSTLAAYV